MNPYNRAFAMPHVILDEDKDVFCDKEGFDMFDTRDVVSYSPVSQLHVSPKSTVRGFLPPVHF